MVGLTLFLVSRRATGSTGYAGLVVAAFAVGSGVLAPLRGRLVDRGGPAWLPRFAGVYALALGALAVAAERTGEVWPFAVCAAVAGASAPPLVATLRARWSVVVEESQLRRAYALTSTVGDVGLVVAPAVGGILFVVAPWLPAIVCAGAALTAALVASRGAPTAQPLQEEERTGGVLPAIRWLVAVSVALGCALGLVDVAVPAAATAWGSAGTAGFLLGAFAFGSVVGGLWFGRRAWSLPPERRYLVAVLLLAVALAPPAAATGPAMLASLLIVSGLAYGPATISLFEALDAVAPTRAVEALTWVTTAEAAGAAAGSAASGWTIAGLGLWAPYTLGAVVLAAAALGTLRRRVDNERLFV